MVGRQFECVVISDDTRVEAGGLSELMEAGCFEDDARDDDVKATLTKHIAVLDEDTFWEDIACEDLHSYRSEVYPPCRRAKLPASPCAWLTLGVRVAVCGSNGLNT
jgi:hypothetical protein